MRKYVLFLCVSAMVCFALTSCTGKKVEQKGDGLSGDISVSGAFALYPLAVKWAEEFQKLHPRVRIDMSAGGAGKGMTDVLAGMVDLGMVSREIYGPELEKGACPVAVAKDAVVMTLNAANPFFEALKKHGISRDVARKIWITGEYTTWGEVLGTADRTPIHVYTRSDACGAAETFALWMGAKQEDLGGTAVFGDPGLAAAVQNDRLGIGLNNIGYVYDENTRTPNPGLAVCPVDTDADGQIGDAEYFYDTKDAFIAAVDADKYPSPPARDLYMVTRGIPDKPAVVAFLEFILSEGQQFNVPAGYIALPEEKLAIGRAALHIR
ncbi:MAG: PstS family phosphate ABC transporter substrate-binding protein [Bacteroidales bacterium]|nr:PstS family phosphate ABC transporter substrate-binding protein [Bacteroidales bacterium]MBR3286876.1 PstS family phosphate ABC transporter substrate-binding protein [Bacteroidales bacterium]